MKISLDFKKDCKDYYLKELEKRGFDIESETSFGNVWVYGLSHIDYIKDRIQLNQDGSMQFFVILLDDLEYIEIHK